MLTGVDPNKPTSHRAQAADARHVAVPRGCEGYGGMPRPLGVRVKKHN